MRTSSPGPPGQANVAPWRRWLLPGIIAAFFVALFALPRGAATGMPLTYTQFVADVGGGTVRAVTIGPAGQVTGSLTSGQPFTTTIPVALGGNGLAGNLAARTRGPAIVFIDEIDALGARRDHGGLAGSDEREQTLNQLLAEMDGFEESAGVVVLAATNRPDALDPALRRPGRFDREVIVPLPDRSERGAILASHARGKYLGPDADLRPAR
jgi:hypothetical protein